MTVLISIDPGVHHYGVAWWHGGSLSGAHFIQKKDLYLHGFDCDEVVCERPQVYLSNLKAANDMVALGIAAGEIAGFIGAKKTTYHLPSVWKGSLPKDVHHQRIFAALRKGELDRIELPKNKEHKLDVLDAVALGLFHLGRTARGGILKKRAS